MTFIDGTMNPCEYTKILADNMTHSLQKLGRRRRFQYDDSPNHTAKIVQEFLQIRKLKTITGPSMLQDLYIIEHLRSSLKGANPTSKEQLKMSKNGRTCLRTSGQ